MHVRVHCIGNGSACIYGCNESTCTYKCTAAAGTYRRVLSLGPVCRHKQPTTNLQIEAYLKASLLYYIFYE